MHSFMSFYKSKMHCQQTKLHKDQRGERGGGRRERDLSSTHNILFLFTFHICCFGNLYMTIMFYKWSSPYELTCMSFSQCRLIFSLLLYDCFNIVFFICFIFVLIDFYYFLDLFAIHIIYVFLMLSK